MVAGQARLAWFWLRTTFRRRWAGYLALVLLVGAVGGVGLGSIAGARRTQSSYPALLRETRTTDLEGPTGVALGPGQSGYSRERLAQISRLPHVAGMETAVGLNVLLLDRHGRPTSVSATARVDAFASLDGFGFDRNRLVTLQGDPPDPRRADEFVTDPETASILGLHLGDVERFGFYSNDQYNSPDFGTAGVRPVHELRAKLVGFVEASAAVVSDDVDRQPFGIGFGPAVARRMLRCCIPYTVSGIAVSGGARNDAAVIEEIGRLLPVDAGLPAYQESAPVEAAAERAVKPQSIALAVFGGISVVAALLIAAQIISRQIHADGRDLATLRALGSDRAMTAGAPLLGILAAAVLGSLLAGAVAFGLSPLTPIGPVRPIDPSAGFAADWTVLVVGVAVLAAVLATVAVALAVRQARRTAQADRAPSRPSTMARVAAGAGLSAPAVIGVRFASERGAGRTAVPVRSVLFGAVMAVAVVAATLTFGASLHELVSRPALYGWNWDAELTAGQGSGELPIAKARTLLDGDPDVEAWSGLYFVPMRIDGLTVPTMAGSPGLAVAPPVLTGHGLEAKDEVVLGALTLAALHKHIGDAVEVTSTVGRPRRLRIVGTATMPTVGIAGQPHPEMGSGALVATTVVPARFRVFPGVPPGPNVINVRFHPGVDRAAAVRRLEQMEGPLSVRFSGATYGVSVLPVQRPAEIVNYRSMGNTPAALGGALALGAAVALGLTLAASVRRRRRDLALLKTLGLSRRQLATTVAWQSTVVVIVGLVVGLPLGVVVGRHLWTLFADEIHVVPSPMVPAGSLVLVVLTAVVLANLAAAIPGWTAARTQVAPVLQGE